MRVAEVFSYGCREMKQSLEWQLGALKKSMEFEADVPNFLEPWYGIGPVASSFGIDYIWKPGQSPATKPAFQTIDDALSSDIKPEEGTSVGKQTLQMIEYFLEVTKGKLPMSMSDIQSPFNNATYIVDTSNFFCDKTKDENLLNYYNEWFEYAPMFGRETTNHFMRPDKKYDLDGYHSAHEVIDKAKQRLKLLRLTDTGNLNERGLKAHKYQEGMENFIASFFENHHNVLMKVYKLKHNSISLQMVARFC